MLKVTIDQGGDYLDYLKPFVLDVLYKYHPEPIVDTEIKEYILKEFGLEIPGRTIQIVLKRLSKRYPLEKKEGVYYIKGNLDNPGIAAKKADAIRNIDSVITGLIEFSQGTNFPISDRDSAVNAICTFLSEFGVQCLRAFLRGTTIPNLGLRKESDIALVSKYVIHLSETSPERFNSFMIMVQGHMIANALLAPDLQNAPKSYSDVTFFFDTPLLIHLLGLEGELKYKAAKELIDLLCRLGAKLAFFSHTKEELRRVILGVAYNLDKTDPRGAIILYARRCQKTKSDFILLVANFEKKLKELGIEEVATPKYNPAFQIDEAAFQEVLDDEISYYNNKAKLFDINSVRSIYAIRKNGRPSMIERAKAVLVTSNAALAHTAWKFGQDVKESEEVSTVVTDLSLANIAWLKLPMAAPNLPRKELLAYSYAALQPSQEFLNKYMVEVDKLEQEQKITSQDHQLLRSSIIAQDELMHLTLGQEIALTEQTITETLQRTIKEIKKEETQKLMAEREAHRQTQQQLSDLQEERQNIKKKLFCRSQLIAKIESWVVFIIILLFLLVALLSGIYTLRNSLARWILKFSTILLIVFSLVSFIWGAPLNKLRLKFEKWLTSWHFKRACKKINID